MLEGIKIHRRIIGYALLPLNQLSASAAILVSSFGVVDFLVFQD